MYGNILLQMMILYFARVSSSRGFVTPPPPAGIAKAISARTASSFSSTSSTTTTTTIALAQTTNFLETLQKNFFSTLSPGRDNGSSSSSKYYTIAITGASGLIGTAVRNELSQRASVNGKPIRIVQLQRGDAEAMPDFSDDDTITDLSIRWNPQYSTTTDIDNDNNIDQVIHPSVIRQVDAIVHLAGENIATGLGPLGFLGIRPWTAAKKQEILNSRVGPTSALARAIAKSGKQVSFLSASGVGIYGDNFSGEECDAVDESMDTSETVGFCPDISRAWEVATKEGSVAKTTNNKSRIVNLRFGVVMSVKGGALAKLYPIFNLGGGGIVGSGQQYLSFISARDVARGIVHVLETPQLSGPVNVCSPEPCTNLQFTSALGKVLNRPTFLPLPSLAVQALFGEMGDEMLLGGVRAIPTKLQKSGFTFLHPSIDDAVTSAILEEKEI
jgi:uncharacterized protein